MEFVSANPEELNSFVIKNDGPLQQSSQWGELQQSMGRNVLHKILVANGEPLMAASFVRHDLRFGKYYWLCPRGPVFGRNFQFSDLPPLHLPLTKGEKERGLGEPIFIRIEPEIFADFRSKLTGAGFVEAPKDHSPRATIFLDLRQDEEELLRAMRPKARYNIGLARKKEVVIESQNSDAKIQDFLHLLKLAASRDGFHLHPLFYYKKMLKMREIRLFLAYFEGQPVAAALVSIFGTHAVYLHGGSDYNLRAVMAPYLLHWEIMRSLKNQGIHTYDLGGVAPETESDHPLASLNRFKNGFGGQYVEYVGSYDYVLNPMWYGIYKMARKIL